MQIATNGLKLEVDVRGAGEPLVLIMGIGTQLVHWQPDFCDGLVARGFQVIRFDNRDIGRSAWLDHLGTPDLKWMLAKVAIGMKVKAPYRLSDMALDVVGLLDSLGLKKAHLLGISMGGMIAQTVAIEHPHRVSSLVSFNSTTGDREFIGKPSTIGALFSKQPQTREEIGDFALHIWRTLGTARYPPDEVDVRRIALEAYDRGVHPQGFMRQFAAILASGSRRRLLRDVTARTLVIHGSDDPLIPMAAGRATADAVPGARFHVIDGLGHVFNRAAWPELTEAITRHAGLA